MVKNPSANTGDAGDVGTIPESGRSPGKRNGKPLQYRMENPMDRGAWQATVQKSDMYRACTLGQGREGAIPKEGSVGPSGKVLCLPT